MKILIAPNAFKNSLPAQEVAEAIKDGLMRSKLKCICECFPIGDGGDGTGNLLREKLKTETFILPVHDPLGRTIQSVYGIQSSSKTAIIEMADASGLRLIEKKDRNILKSTSFGTGEMIRDSLERGVKKIILAIGGSATVDGGVGILKALGIRFIDDKANDIEFIPGDISKLVKIDITEMDRRILDTEFVILCDVLNPLTGPDGAARIFGPQKSASEAEVRVLESSLESLSEVIQKFFKKDVRSLKYGGAAGGVAASLYAIWNAKLVHGIDYFLSLTNFDDSLNDVQLVITGEGSIDEQTLHGKGPFGVALRAKNLGIPVIGIAGEISKENVKLKKYFDVLLSINDPQDVVAVSMLKTKPNLQNAAMALGNAISGDRTLKSFK